MCKIMIICLMIIKHMFWLRNKKVNFYYAFLSGGLLLLTMHILRFEKVIYLVKCVK